MCIRDRLYDELISYADLYDSANFEAKKMVVNQLIRRVDAVSYTHLDVYKRQVYWYVLSLCVMQDTAKNRKNVRNRFSRKSCSDVYKRQG